MYAYEIHIVAYNASELTSVPTPFFLNDTTMASGGLSGIATVESDDLNSAYRAFESACEWSSMQVSVQPVFGCHVKLEQVRSARVISQPMFRSLPRQIKYHPVIFSPLISAWDVHLDGQFDPRLLNFLVEQGYIRLDYKNSKGDFCITLTKHFLRQNPCKSEFGKIAKGLTEGGGFSGSVYWEDPLGFVVYGNTQPRPIVM